MTISDQEDRTYRINEPEFPLAEVVPGECLQGGVVVSYPELVERFGEPFSISDARSDVGWWIEDGADPNHYALVYNWKSTLRDPEFEETRFWYVDGNSPEAVTLVRRLLPNCGDLTVAPAAGPMRVNEELSNCRFVRLLSGEGNTVGWISYDGGAVAEEDQEAQARATARLFGSADDLVVALPSSTPSGALPRPKTIASVPSTASWKPSSTKQPAGASGTLLRAPNERIARSGNGGHENRKQPRRAVSELAS